MLYLEVSAANPLPIANTISIDDLVSELEQDPEMAKALSVARATLSTTLYADAPATFSAIRLSAGLSQSQLADKLATSQPYIARLETGKLDPGTDMIAKLALALNKDESLIFSAIRNQRKTRVASSEGSK